MKRRVLHNLFGLWWVDLGPFHSVTLGAVVEVSPEQCEEVVHFRLESLRGNVRPDQKRVDVVRTFFSSASVQESPRLFSAFRICDAATDVEVFSKA